MVCICRNCLTPGLTKANTTCLLPHRRPCALLLKPRASALSQGKCCPPPPHSAGSQCAPRGVAKGRRGGVALPRGRAGEQPGFPARGDSRVGAWLPPPGTGPPSTSLRTAPLPGRSAVGPVSAPPAGPANVTPRRSHYQISPRLCRLPSGRRHLRAAATQPEGCLLGHGPGLAPVRKHRPEAESGGRPTRSALPNKAARAARPMHGAWELGSGPTAGLGPQGLAGAPGAPHGRAAAWSTSPRPGPRDAQLPGRGCPCAAPGASARAALGTRLCPHGGQLGSATA